MGYKIPIWPSHCKQRCGESMRAMSLMVQSRHGVNVYFWRPFDAQPMSAKCALNGCRTTSFLHFTSHQNGLKFAKAKLKNSIDARYFTKISVCKKEHWIV